MNKEIMECLANEAATRAGISPKWRSVDVRQGDRYWQVAIEYPVVMYGKLAIFQIVIPCDEEYGDIYDINRMTSEIKRLRKADS